MNTSEFSNEFDVLLNSHSISKPLEITQSPLELDEYEKSVLLTEAQEFVVRGLYNGTLQGKPFEKTEEIRRSLDSLIRTAKLNSVSSSEGRHSTLFGLPQDLWFITYESVIFNDPNAGCMNGKEIQVIPMTQDEWHRSNRNPFKKPSNRKVIRLDSGSLMVELISEYNIGTYIIKYLARPNPIILTDLEGVSINGQKNKTECELSPIVHRIILERAVQFALSRIPQTGK